jgi:hypothetical protein
MAAMRQGMQAKIVARLVCVGGSLKRSQLLEVQTALDRGRRLLLCGVSKDAELNPGVGPERIRSLGQDRSGHADDPVSKHE